MSVDARKARNWHAVVIVTGASGVLRTGQPLEALGALLNVAAKAEIGPGGTKLEFEKRGLRQMGKAATAEAQRD